MGQGLGKGADDPERVGRFGFGRFATGPAPSVECIRPLSPRQDLWAILPPGLAFLLNRFRPASSEISRERFNRPADTRHPRLRRRPPASVPRGHPARRGQGRPTPKRDGQRGPDYASAYWHRGHRGGEAQPASQPPDRPRAAAAAAGRATRDEARTDSHARTRRRKAPPTGGEAKASTGEGVAEEAGGGGVGSRPVRQRVRSSRLGSPRRSQPTLGTDSSGRIGVRTGTRAVPSCLGKLGVTLAPLSNTFAACPAFTFFRR